MDKSLKKLLLVALMAVCTAFSAGCVAVAVGAAAAGGTVAYVRGDLEVTYDHDLERVYQASLAAVRDLGYSLVSDRGDRTGGEMILRTSSDRRIRITMEPIADRVTKVKIRVGAFGDQDLSVYIHETIRNRL